MKQLVQLRQKSNDQLNNRLNDIAVSTRRVQGYNKGACKSFQGNHPMLLHKLKREKAQILTILNERKLNINNP